nr:DUF4134 family protein [Alphaproteobacteria bacterium]
MTKKRFFFSAAFILAVTGAFAQDGSAGINEATSMVTSYFEPATRLIY